MVGEGLAFPVGLGVSPFVGLGEGITVAFAFGVAEGVDVGVTGPSVGVVKTTSKEGCFGTGEISSFFLVAKKKMTPPTIMTPVMIKRGSGHFLCFDPKYD